MLLSVISTFGIIFSNIYQIKKEGIKIRLTTKGIRKHFSPMLLLFSSSVAISIYTMLDSFMLGLLSTYSEVAFYRNASTLCKTLLSIVTSLSAVALPRIAFYFKKRDYNNINILASKSVNIISFLALPMAVGIACIAPVFVPLFLGDQFVPAVMPTIIMSGVIIAIGYSNLMGIQILLGMGYDKLFLYSVLIGTFSNLILNFLFIPIWGATGAAMSSVIAEFAIVFVQIFIIKRHTSVRFRKIKTDIWKSSIALLFIPIAFGLEKIVEGWWYIIILISVCSILYYVSQMLLKNSSCQLITETIAKTLIKKQQG